MAPRMDDEAESWQVQLALRIRKSMKLASIGYRGVTAAASARIHGSLDDASGLETVGNSVHVGEILI